jgi:hypothetical protein
MNRICSKLYEITHKVNTSSYLNHLSFNDQTIGTLWQYRHECRFHGLLSDLNNENPWSQVAIKSSYGRLGNEFTSAWHPWCILPLIICLKFYEIDILTYETNSLPTNLANSSFNSSNRDVMWNNVKRIHFTIRISRWNAFLYLRSYLHMHYNADNMNAIWNTCI